MLRIAARPSKAGVRSSTAWPWSVSQRAVRSTAATTCGSGATPISAAVL
jgi:hypothetical protein